MSHISFLPINVYLPNSIVTLLLLKGGPLPQPLPLRWCRAAHCASRAAAATALLLPLPRCRHRNTAAAAMLPPLPHCGHHCGSAAAVLPPPHFPQHCCRCNTRLASSAANTALSPSCRRYYRCRQGRRCAAVLLLLLPPRCRCHQAAAIGLPPLPTPQGCRCGRQGCCFCRHCRCHC
jgi:hypothetical protein